MDSMDWFDSFAPKAAETQILALNKALAIKGRVLLRSAGRRPWYLEIFEQSGFAIKNVGLRLPGSCIDRVNMYASTWLCTKMEDAEALDATSVTYHDAIEEEDEEDAQSGSDQSSIVETMEL
jgi:betaine lipid synthase